MMKQVGTAKTWLAFYRKEDTTDLFLRMLTGDRNEEDGIDNKNDNNVPDNTNSELDPKVFWPVNGFIFLLVVCACIGFHLFGGLPWMRLDEAQNRREASDQAFRQRVARRLEREEERKRGSPEKRRRQLLRSFQRCNVHMVVRESDLVDSKGEQPLGLLGEEEGRRKKSTLDNNHDSDVSTLKMEVEVTAVDTITVEKSLHNVDIDDDELETGSSSSPECRSDDNTLAEVDLEATAAAKLAPPFPSSSSVENNIGHDSESGTLGYLVLRPPSFSSKQQTNVVVQSRLVPNYCAICLSCYEVGEQVVWSSNAECPHAFHLECLVDWLTKMRIGTPCPCCRAEFTDLEKQRQERRITWGPGNTFNPAVVTI